MDELLVPFLAAVAGLLMGILYFGGLWATVVRLQTVPNPGFYLLASLILRLGCCLAGVATISYYSGWLALAFAMAGFTLARVLVIHEFQKRALQQGHRQ